MDGKPNGYVIQRNAPGDPVLLVFDTLGAGRNRSNRAERWERIALHRGQSCSLVLLQAARGAGYYSGVAGLGDSIEEAAESLRSLITRLNASDVFTCGAALDGHAALFFGALLNASRVVAVEPVAHLVADELERYNDRRWHDVLAAMPEQARGPRSDVLDVMMRTKFRGDAFVLFGTGRGNDVNQAAHLNLVHAEWLARSNRVVLCPFPDVWQDLWGELERRGEFEKVMTRYLFEEQRPRRDIRNQQSEVREEFEHSPAPPATARYYFGSVTRDIHESDSDKLEVLYTVAGNGEAPELQHVDDELRRWIAENLLIGQPPHSIAGRMATIGVPECVALDEIRRAIESPYIRGALRLQNRLKKRDWLLSAYGKLGRLHLGFERVERRQKLSRDDFFADYYTLNRPVIVDGMIDDWPARARWSLGEFERRFGDQTVKMRLRLNDTDNAGLPKAHETQLVTFGEFIQMVCAVGQHGDFCLTTEDAENHDIRSGVLKDIGPVPEYLDETAHDVLTFRLDPVGAITPFRHDFKNILIALAMGRARVKIVPAWDLTSMRNTWQNLSEHDGRQMVAMTPSDGDRPQVLECSIEQGDLLFIPVGCWYFIETIEVSASVTFTRFIFDNEFSIPDIVDGVL